MKGFLQEYGIIMVVVAVVLGMLAFGKTGYAKGIQDAILGSADHIVDTGENIVPKPVKASDIIEIEGTKYVVLKECEGYQALVMTASSIGEKAFQSNYGSNTYLRPDGQYANTYEGSEIDNYLENEWYPSLSIEMQKAIQPTNIKQTYFYNYNKYERNDYGYVPNTINRHVYLLSDFHGKYGQNASDIIYSVQKNTLSWTRTAHQTTKHTAQINRNTDKAVNSNYAVYPAFVIDLSQVDYTEAGHVDYK